MTSLDFPTYSFSLIKTIQDFAATQNDSEQFGSIVKQFKQNSSSEFFPQTDFDHFYHSLCPALVTTILETKSDLQYSNILNQFIHYLIPFFASRFSHEHSQLMTQFQRIFLDEKAPFYSSVLSPPSPLFRENYIILSQTDFIKNVEHLFRPKSFSDPEKFSSGFMIVHKLRNHVDFTGSEEFYYLAAKSFCRVASNLDEKSITSVNEKNLLFISAAISRKLPLKSKMFIRLKQSIIKFYALLSLSPVLEKKSTGLASIHKLILDNNQSFQDILLIINQHGIVQNYFRNPHPDTVKSFASVFKFLINQKYSGFHEMLTFWKILIQNPFPNYFQAWRIIYSSLSDQFRRNFWQIITENPIVNDSFLELIDSFISTALPEEKLSIVSMLLGIFSSSYEHLSFLFFSVIRSAIHDNSELSLIVQNKCFEMIFQKNNINLCLQVIKVTASNVDDFNFPIFIHKILELADYFEVGPFLNFLGSFIKQAKVPLSPPDDELIFSLIETCYLSFPEDLLSFFHLMFKYQKNFFFEINKLKVVFTKLTEIEIFHDIHLSILMLIFRAINIGNIRTVNGVTFPISMEHMFLLDILWKVLEKTNSPNIASFISSFYVHSLNKTDISNFIQICFSRIKKIGYLLCLKLTIQNFLENHDLDSHRIEYTFLYSDYDYIHVNLSGAIERKIKVFQNISFDAFLEKISFIMETVPQNIQIYISDILMNKSNFQIEEDVMIEVKRAFTRTVSGQVDSGSDFSPLFQLSKKSHVEILYQILISSPLKDQQKLALEILLYLPPYIPVLDELFKNESTKCNEMFSTENPYLFIYKCHIIGSILTRLFNPLWVKYFCDKNRNSFLFSQLLDLNSELLDFENNSRIFYYLLVILIQKSSGKNRKRLGKRLQIFGIDKLVHKALIYININQFIFERILQLIGYLADFNPYCFQNSSSFHNIFRVSIFHSAQSVRLLISSIATRIPSEFTIDLLSNMLKYLPDTHCRQFWSVVNFSLNSVNDPHNFFEDFLGLLYSRIPLPSEDLMTCYQNLCIPSLSRSFSTSLFSILTLLFSKWPYHHSIKELFHHVVNSILFNPYKYFNPPQDLFNSLLTILKIHSHFGEFLKKHIFSSKKSPVVSVDIQSVCPSKYRGIKNLGHLCYMNSIIQQLYFIKEYRQLILTNAYPQNEWLSTFQHLFAQLQLFPTSYIDPTPFVQSWKWKDKSIDIHEQQDADEFIQLIIEDVAKYVPETKKLFQGRISNQIEGISNEYHLEKIEPFITFPIDIKDISSIEEGLKSFLSVDFLTGSNQYQISSTEIIDAKRYSTIIKSPSILIFQLKRFQFNLTLRERYKLNSPFLFSRQIDISFAMKDASQPQIYCLVGIVMHSGTAQTGHYYSYVCAENEQWICCNDSIISPIDSKNIFSHLAGRVVESSNSACILIYRKIEPIISINIPSINIQLITETISSIHNVIQSKRVSDRKYLSFQMSSVEAMGDNSLFMSMFLASVKTVNNPEVASDSLRSLVSLCKNSPACAQTILNNIELHFEMFFRVKNVTIRKLYSQTLTELMNLSSNVDGYFHFLQKYIPTCSNFIEYFDTFLYPLKNIIDTKLTKYSEWILLISTFLSKSLSQFQLPYSNNNIQLSCFFEILSLLTAKGDFKSSIHPDLLSFKNLTFYFNSTNSSESVFNFLIVFLNQYPSIAHKFVSLIMKSKRTFTCSFAAALFSICIFLDYRHYDKTIIWFFSRYSKIYCLNLLMFLTSIRVLFNTLKSIHFSECFLQNYKFWSINWLFNQNENARKECILIIQTVFSDADTKPLSKFLLQSIKSLGDFLLDSEYSAHTYYDLLLWSIQKSNSFELLVEKSQKLIKLLNKENNNFDYRSIFLKFLSEVIPPDISSQFFTTTKMFAQFLEAFDSLQVNTDLGSKEAIEIIKLVPASFSNILMNSRFMLNCLRFGFTRHKKLTKTLVSFFTLNLSLINPNLIVTYVFDFKLLSSHMIEKSDYFDFLSTIFLKSTDMAQAFFSIERVSAYFNIVSNSIRQHSQSIVAPIIESFVILINSTPKHSNQFLQFRNFFSQNREQTIKIIRHSISFPCDSALQIALIHFSSSIIPVDSSFIEPAINYLSCFFMASQPKETIVEFLTFLSVINLHIRINPSLNLQHISNSYYKQLSDILSMTKPNYLIYDHLCSSIELLLTGPNEWEGKISFIQNLEKAFSLFFSQTDDLTYFSSNVTKLLTIFNQFIHLNKSLYSKRCEELIWTSFHKLKISVSNETQNQLAIIRLGLDFFRACGAKSKQQFKQVADYCHDIKNPHSTDIEVLVSLLDA